MNDLTIAETNRLREYLLRGGFLVVDDFWGPEQWEMKPMLAGLVLLLLPAQTVPADQPAPRAGAC
jgi:Domain of unknown function (DUF4159)